MGKLVAVKRAVCTGFESDGKVGLGVLVSLEEVRYIGWEGQCGTYEQEGSSVGTGVAEAPGGSFRKGLVDKFNLHRSRDGEAVGD
jgi:hypothetical protein